MGTFQSKTLCFQIILATQTVCDLFSTEAVLARGGILVQPSLPSFQVQCRLISKLIHPDKDQSVRRRLEEMQGYSGNDLGRFVTTYNSEYSCQRTEGGDRILCKLSVQLTTQKKSIQNEIVGGKQFVKEGKSRRGETGQGWKVTKGARERNPKGFFGPKKQSDKYAVSYSENKGTQTQKLTYRSSRAVEDIWKNKKMQRPNLENLSKVHNT